MCFSDALQYALHMVSQLPPAQYPCGFPWSVTICVTGTVTCCVTEIVTFGVTGTVTLCVTFCYRFH